MIVIIILHAGVSATPRAHVHTLKNPPEVACGTFLYRVYVFFTVLLIGNLHTVEFTHLQCTGQWFIAHLQSCEPITPERKSVPIEITPPVSSPVPALGHESTLFLHGLACSGRFIQVKLHHVVSGDSLLSFTHFADFT